MRSRSDRVLLSRNYGELLVIQGSPWAKEDHHVREDHHGGRFLSRVSISRISRKDEFTKAWTSPSCKGRAQYAAELQFVVFYIVDIDNIELYGQYGHFLMSLLVQLWRA